MAGASETLTTNGSRPALPPVPRLELFYGIEPNRTIGFRMGSGFLDDQILALPIVIGIVLSDSLGWLLRIDLEKEDILVLTPRYAYSQRLLETVAVLYRFRRSATLDIGRETTLFL